MPFKLKNYLFVRIAGLYKQKDGPYIGIEEAAISDKLLFAYKVNDIQHLQYFPYLCSRLRSCWPYDLTQLLYKPNTLCQQKKYSL